MQVRIVKSQPVRRYQVAFILNAVENFKIILFLSVVDIVGAKLSTFPNTKQGVQMRRTTNKKGKTAPAPPKRTR